MNQMISNQCEIYTDETEWQIQQAKWLPAVFRVVNLFTMGYYVSVTYSRLYFLLLRLDFLSNFSETVRLISRN